MAAPSAPPPLPPQLAALLDAVDGSLDAVEAALDPYLAGPLKHLVTQLAPLDNARLNTSLAFCSASLLFGACVGPPPLAHPPPPAAAAPAAPRPPSTDD